MTTIEYKGEVIEVPTSWDEIKLKHYENFYTEKPENIREKVALVAKICNVDPVKLLSQPTEVFNTMLDCTRFIFQEPPREKSAKVIIDGVTFVIPIEEKLSLGAFIDADETQKSGENIFSGVLAIVCRPEGEAYDPELIEQRTAAFGELPMSQIWPLLAFFLHCKNALDQRTTAFTNLVGLVESLPRNIGPSLRLGGGTKLSQMWQTIRYYFLMKLLNYRLRRLLRLSNTAGIKTTQTRRKGN